MELDDFFKERTDRFELIATFLAAINACVIFNQTDRRKNRKGKQWYVVFSHNSEEKLGIDNCYVDELDFDINWNRLWVLVEIIESLGYSLVVYPDECYWLTEDGDYLVEETFTGEKRINFVFDACMNFITQYK